MKTLNTVLIVLTLYFFSPLLLIQNQLSDPSDRQDTALLSLADSAAHESEESLFLEKVLTEETLVEFGTYSVLLKPGENVRYEPVSGRILEGVVATSMDVETPIGRIRLAEGGAVAFHETGIRSVKLGSPSEVRTPLGSVKAMPGEGRFDLTLDEQERPVSLFLGERYNYRTEDEHMEFREGSLLLFKNGRLHQVSLPSDHTIQFGRYHLYAKGGKDRPPSVVFDPVSGHVKEVLVADGNKVRSGTHIIRIMPDTHVKVKKENGKYSITEMICDADLIVDVLKKNGKMREEMLMRGMKVYLDNDVIIGLKGP